MTVHLLEMEIQEYALDKIHCRKDIADHIAVCEACRMKAANYELMFSVIKEEPKHSFDFDLASLVVEQLPKPSSVSSSTNILLYVFIFCFAGAIAFVIYWFREYLEKMFKGILPIVIYLMLVIAISVLIFQCVEIYRRYKKQMKSLNSF
ncbi:MAG: hypothetical protein JST75_22405 [Bacteroidetes bacterium]|nr:hypothetical protein [Bacteroidota bacterium]